jgi:hypothetical protein
LAWEEKRFQSLIGQMHVIDRFRRSAFEPPPAIRAGAG